VTISYIGVATIIYRGIVTIDNWGFKGYLADNLNFAFYYNKLKLRS